MKIIGAVVSPGLTGFYFDDQKAIKLGRERDGFALLGEPATAGFSAVRQRGESISVMLLLDNGAVAYGDCAAVQYSGAGGRDPLFLAADFIPVLEEEVFPRLIGRTVSGFRRLAEEFDKLRHADGSFFHTALRYGITQALLDAAARSAGCTMAEIVAREYHCPLVNRPVPLFCQTGDDRYSNADKAIIKGADVLPHGLINNVREKLGCRGEKLLEYVSWLKNRAGQLGGADYRPVLHIDVYGTIGQAFDEDLEQMADYLGRLEKAAAPLKLRIEGPMDRGNKPAQIEALAGLCRLLEKRGIAVAVVADEWCNTLEDIREFVDAKAGDMVQIKTPDLGGINNTIEAVLYARSRGTGAYLGGTCNETDRSARVCVHVGIATQPDQMLAKPGMGVDEGLMITFNEMSRTLALLKVKGVI
ncbi:methylaspartate ammonia-lyase [Desulforamulus ruminis]|uniref:methylaspartate ammonia-lyase n=1 Tax=Desulforamulus ruminis (strain ATCC 23193 / DSM 2154 / NCIMB 8452 / DL) TaxID=696281 RepID=F6DJY9_DESRL|nr:methylaspartate ammonia-lyase [Desulforamulus ruminis]AEG59203.1 methylaspartate ammonia-lyase [Desulforamulus ruminis DSM 2154]